MAKGVIEKIKCDKCGYENEPQRIFCHECGAKLDRSEYVQEVEETRIREAKEAPKRLNDLKRKKPTLTVANVLIYGLGPFLTAVLIQMMAPMNGTTAQGGEVEEAESFAISSELVNALELGSPKSLTVKEGSASTALDRKLQPGKDDKTYLEKAARGGWVFFDEGQLTVVTRRALTPIEALPTYFSATYKPVDVADGQTLVLDSFYIGRLKLPGSLGNSLVPSLLGDVPKAASVKPESLNRIQKLELKDGTATLTVK